MKLIPITYNNISWYNLFQPTEEEANLLIKQFEIHPLHVEDIVAIKTQRPKLEQTEDYLFFTLHFPLFQEESNKIKIAELNTIISKKYIITVYSENFNNLEKLYQNMKNNKNLARKYLINGPFYLFYKIIHQQLLQNFRVVNKLGKEIDNLDKQMFNVKAVKIVETISTLRRNFVVMHTAFKPQVQIFESLKQIKHPTINQEMSQYWSDISDIFSQLREIVEDCLELVEGLSQTHDAVLTFRTNEIIKILTIFSVIMLPMNLIAAIYGMNIQSLPVASSPLTLIYILTVMLLGATFMLIVFKIKRWI